MTTPEEVAAVIGKVERGSIIRLSDSSVERDGVLAGALAKAVREVAGHDEFLIIQGDVTVDSDLEARLCDAMEPILSAAGLPLYGYPLREATVELRTGESPASIPDGEGDRGDLVSDLATAAMSVLRGDAA